MMKPVLDVRERDLYRTMAGHHQYLPELEELMVLFQRENVCSYLEVGSRFGASFWAIGCALPTGSLMVAIDKPGQMMHSGETRASMEACAQELQATGQRVKLLWGDSTDPSIVARAKAFGPYDAVLIDANHTKPYVESDWKNYGPMGRIVAFHDIAFHREPGTYMKLGIDVPEVWKKVREGHRYQEIKMDPTGQDNGFGVLWRV